jgi:hypothetical protein
MRNRPGRIGTISGQVAQSRKGSTAAPAPFVGTGGRSESSLNATSDGRTTTTAATAASAKPASPSRRQGSRPRILGDRGGRTGSGGAGPAGRPAIASLTCSKPAPSPASQPARSAA